MQTVTLGFSPCPNDTFIFDAMIHGKIDTEGLDFEVFMEDVEALNRRAFAGGIVVTKLSYHAFAHLAARYILLNAGSAVGNRCGPLLIARAPMNNEQIETARIAIPGKMTTANFLLSLAFPKARNTVETIFSDIENAVLNGNADAGLIIHENRFTYAQKGLIKLLDLGEFWEDNTGFPIPLGGIAVRRDISPTIQQRIDRVLRRSVAYAFSHPDDVMPFVRRHAQEMDEAVMRAHIDLYVTEYTARLGQQGRGAVREMMRIGQVRGIIPAFEGELFVEESC